MFLKRGTEFLSKNQFYVLIIVSVIIHSLAISLSPQTKHFFSRSSLRNSFVRDLGSDIVEIALVDNTTPEEKKVDASSNKKEEMEKKRRPRSIKSLLIPLTPPQMKILMRRPTRLAKKARWQRTIFPMMASQLIISHTRRDILKRRC